MTANEYRAICDALMRNHHERLLEEAIKRGDAAATAHETKVLEALKSMLA